MRRNTIVLDKALADVSINNKGSNITKRSTYSAKVDKPRQDEANTVGKKQSKASWMSLPNKGQMAIITYARITESMTQTGFGSFMYHQLSSFDRRLAQDQIAQQAGIIRAGFSIGACCTAVVWSRLARNDLLGKRGVVVLALSIACMGCVGMAFSTSFQAVLVSQVLCGVASGIVGIIRAMIMEIVVDEDFQSRAYSLMPLATTVGSTTGPALAGLLITADETWTSGWPYAPPMLFCALSVIVAIPLVLWGLKTIDGSKLSPGKPGRVDPATEEKLGSKSHETGENKTCTVVTRRHPKGSVSGGRDGISSSPSPEQRAAHVRMSPKLWSCIAVKLLSSLHVTAFASALSTFLPMQLAGPETGSGGFGFSVKEFGTATSLVAILRYPMQLLLFPRLHQKIGAPDCLRKFLFLGTISYLGFALLTVPPDDELVRWVCAVVLMTLHHASVVVTFPAILLIINGATKSPDHQASVHSLLHSMDMACAAFGSFMGGWLVSFEVWAGWSGITWLSIASVAMVNVYISRFIVA